jgi:hypothetical protein
MSEDAVLRAQVSRTQMNMGANILQAERNARGCPVRLSCNASRLGHRLATLAARPCSSNALRLPNEPWPIEVNWRTLRGSGQAHNASLHDPEAEQGRDAGGGDLPEGGISQATYFTGRKKYDGLLPTEMRVHLARTPELEQSTR